MPFAVLLLLAALLPAADEPVLKEGAGRIIFVGDSITGLSRNFAEGYAHRIEAALKAAHPEAKPELISLGGSGQSVESWQGVEKGSRDKETFLDIKGVEVRATLGRPADGLVVMLGMNNVLAPYIADDEKSIEAWAGRYRELVTALRARCTPRVTALCSVTPCTEDPESPRNRLIGRMNRRVQALAGELGARFCDTGGTVRGILARGRTLKPDFHVTYDYVHPDRAGHLGVAIAMLRGLGEPAAAAWLESGPLAAVWQEAVAKGPGFSWRVAPAPGGLALDWWWTGAATGAAPAVRLAVPEGWTCVPAASSGTCGSFALTGTPDRLRTLLTISGQAGDTVRSATISVPAPWLATAHIPQDFWKGSVFEAARAANAVDRAIVEGGDPLAAAAGLPGAKPAWTLILPSADFTGGDDPGSIDFTALSTAANFEGGYALRWVHSAKARPVNLALTRRTFAGEMHLTAWLDGKELHSGPVPGGPGLTATGGALRAGWNLLALKACHRTWQWQVSASLAGVGGDDLADLRYATAPPSAGR